MFDWKTNLRVFQLINRLYFSIQIKPRTTGFEGALMTLNAMMLWCPSSILFNGVGSWVIFHDTRGLPSITSTRIGFLFVTSSNLWQSTKSLSMKHVEAPKSNKVWTLILLESIFTISGIIKQEETSEVRIGPLIKECATFPSHTVLTMDGHLCFPIQHLPPLIEYSLKHFGPYVVLRLKLFIGQSQAWWFFPPQHKDKSYLCCRSFSFCDNFLNLKESICIGSGIDALVGACFHGEISWILHSLCVECRSYQCSNNQLSHHSTWWMASANVNWLCKFKSKSLTLSHNPHWNALIKVLSFQLMSYANWQKSAA